MSNFAIKSKHFDILCGNFKKKFQGDYSLTYRKSQQNASLGKSKSVILAIFANIVLITTGKPNKLKKIHNHLKKLRTSAFFK